MVKHHNTKEIFGETGAKFGMAAMAGKEKITARIAGAMDDMHLPVSPASVSAKAALRNMAKAINLALKSDFIESDLDLVYKAARVHANQVEVLHHQYIGLGNGLFAKIGKLTRSFSLTLRGPDPASPGGEKWYKKHGTSPLRGVIDLIGRKLNLIREFEDMAPIYLQQMLDRLEAKRFVQGWNRDEWEISTTNIGLDLILKPVDPGTST